MIEFCCSMKFWHTWFSFTYQSKKLALYSLIMTKFQIPKAYLWFIYRETFEFIVYTSIFEVWEIEFFSDLFKAKSTQILDSWHMSEKTRAILKSIVLCLMDLDCAVICHSTDKSKWGFTTISKCRPLKSMYADGFLNMTQIFFPFYW